MGCMDDRYYGFEATNDLHSTRRFGHLDDGYPGCGYCPDCCYYADYDRNKIAANAAKAERWHERNPYTYLCKWETEQGYYGSFIFRSGSLEEARKVAKNSLFDWSTLLVSRYK